MSRTIRAWCTLTLLVMASAGCRTQLLEVEPEAADLGAVEQDAAADGGASDLAVMAGMDGSPPDLGASLDLATPPDLTASLDLAPPLDLAIPSDLAPPRDLAPTPDLRTPPDLSVPPDLAAPPDLSVPLDLAAPPDLLETPDMMLSCKPQGTPDPAPLWRSLDVLPIGGMPNSADAVAIADVTDDGREDVVVAITQIFDQAVYVVVLPQLADGQLGPPDRYLVERAGTLPPSLAVGDFNRDGRIDVAISQSRGIAVLFQNRAGRLNLRLRYGLSRPALLTSGDFNGDGRGDVALLDATAPAVEILLGSINSFTPGGRYAVPHGAQSDMAVGDVNGDGRDDLVVTSRSGPAAAQLLLGQPGGVLQEATPYPVPGLPSGVAVGDVTGDCLGDVVVSYGNNQPNASIAVLAGQPDGTLGLATRLPSFDRPEDLAVTDVDNDGAGDAVVLHALRIPVGVYRQLPDGTLVPEERYNFNFTSSGPQKLAVGDINGDGKPDVVSADFLGLYVLYHN